FPAYVIARGLEDAARAHVSLRYPMIVKHPNSYASVGLTADSRVMNQDALRREIARMCKEYGSALVEEFIEGREVTILACEPGQGEADPWVLAPVEFVFPKGE